MQWPTLKWCITTRIINLDHCRSGSIKTEARKGYWNRRNSNFLAKFRYTNKSFSLATLKLLIQNSCRKNIFSIWSTHTFIIYRSVTLINLSVSNSWIWNVKKEKLKGSFNSWMVPFSKSNQHLKMNFSRWTPARSTESHLSMRKLPWCLNKLWLTPRPIICKESLRSMPTIRCNCWTTTLLWVISSPFFTFSTSKRSLLMTTLLPCPPLSPWNLKILSLN